MPLRKMTSSLTISIIQMLLDLYAEKTQLPVALFQSNSNNFIWSKNGTYSPLCLELCSGLSLPKCEKDHIKRCTAAKGTIELCHVGLWNVALPIKVENKIVGVLLSGQRRLRDEKKNRLSFAKFSKYIRERNFNDTETEIILRDKFDRTPIIDQENFDKHLLESLRNIQQYLYSWIFTLNEEDKIKRQRIQQLAHEFLLPIQSIIANSENLFYEINDPELKEIAQTILQEMQKLAMISENMRDSLIEAKVEPYQYSKHNIFKLLTKNVDLYQIEANKKGVTISAPYTRDNDNFPELEVSPDDLSRAFSNLIHNAVKYSFSSYEGDRYINIIGESDGDYYKISIQNYGTGILPHEIVTGKIFELGYRGELSADRHRTGSGMGLSETKKILDKHNGKIKIFSDPKGKAYKTTVSVFLPFKR